jgi:hypothetical protein
MRSRLFPMYIGVVAAVITASSVAWGQVSRPPPEGAAPPRQISNLADAILQTSAVIEATVRDITYEFSDAEGPWTRIVLGDVTAHFGRAPTALELFQFGGQLPNQRMMAAAELPVFVRGARYVVFLRNTAWNISPVVGGLALRVENVDGNELLVASHGETVIGLGAGGVDFAEALFEPAPYSGRPAVRNEVTLSSLPGRPLDRRSFVAALRAELDAQNLSITGPFYDRPAGGFTWRRQAMVPHGQPTTGGQAGVDTSAPGN